MIRSLLLVGFALCVVGCASAPTYTESEQSNAALLRGSRANFFRFYGGEAFVHLAEIDGLASGANSLRITPGKHRIGVLLMTLGNEGRDYLDLTLAPNREYSFHAQLVGLSFKLDFLDVTGCGRRVVKSFRVMSGSSPPTQVTPIFIPVAS